MAVLTQLLEKAPGINLLVTSRERLNCYGEQVFVVAALPYPVQETELVTAVHSAVQLFVDRARSVHPDFRLTDENQRHVVHICRLVGGLPLALELAAAWVKMLSCAEIAQKLAQNLDFLTATLSGVPERHQTLQAVFTHSWQRLSEAEQQVFRALAIFPDSFTREAAAAVAGATLPNLSSLVDKSFLSRQAPDRFAIHPVLHEYGLQELQRAQMHETYADRHSIYYLNLLQRQDAALSEADQKVHSEIEFEMDNVRQAWDRAVTQQQIDRVQKAAGILYDFYQYKHRQQEGIAHFSRTLHRLHELPEVKENGVVDSLTARLGALYNHLGQHQQARRCLEESLAAAQRAGDERETAFALSTLARLNAKQRNYRDAGKLSRNALARYEQLGDRAGMAENLLCLGFVAQGFGKFDEAFDYYQRTWALARQTNIPFLKTETLRLMATIAGTHYHDYTQAITYLEHVYWHCYCVLAAHQDWRALPVLRRAYGILQQRAQRTSSPRLQDSFLRLVRENREIGRALAQNAATAVPANRASHVNPLTPREVEILRLVGAGFTNKVRLHTLCIAATLRCSTFLV